VATVDEPAPKLLLVDAPPAFPGTAAAARWLGPEGLDATYKAGMEALLDAALP
jgi:hypothetical protein